MYFFKKIGLLILSTISISCYLKAQQTQQATIAKTITITNFRAYEKDAKQVVEWHTAASEPANYWQIQGSTDGTRFTTIAIVLGDDPQLPGTYRYSERLKRGKSLQQYYRLCHIDTGGTAQISEIIRPAK